MTRYYYDCPIKAAYMAKYFSMKIVDYEMEEITEDAYFGFGNPDLRYIIHPESLPLLEPVVGDGIQTKYGLDNIKHISDDGWIESFGGSDYAPEEYKIIYRNNTAFIWPESED